MNIFDLLLRLSVFFSNFFNVENEFDNLVAAIVTGNVYRNPKRSVAVGGGRRKASASQYIESMHYNKQREHERERIFSHN
jgi:hypothetical protein